MIDSIIYIIFRDYTIQCTHSASEKGALYHVAGRWLMWPSLGIVAINQ